MWMWMGSVQVTKRVDKMMRKVEAGGEGWDGELRERVGPQSACSCLACLGCLVAVGRLIAVR